MESAAFVTAVFERLIYSGLTLYMLVILTRWLGPWLELDVEYGRLRWVTLLTQPLYSQIRKVLPPLGPMDFVPIVALLIVYFIRSVVVAAMMSTSPLVPG